MWIWQDIRINLSPALTQTFSGATYLVLQLCGGSSLSVGLSFAINLSYLLAGYWWVSWLLLSCYAAILLSCSLAILLSCNPALMLSCSPALLLSCYPAILLSSSPALLLSFSLGILLSCSLALLLISVFDRPGVAGAVLQTASLLTDSLSEPFPKISS